MTDQQIIERLAEFLGWELTDAYNNGVECDLMVKRGDKYDLIGSPLKSWDTWRQVEEKIMEDEELTKKWFFHLASIEFPKEIPCMVILKADLPTRCNALISVLKS